MSNTNIDLSKFISEPANILERLYKEEGEELPILTKEEFDNLPLNENYIKAQELKKNTVVNHQEPSEALPER